MRRRGAHLTSRNGSLTMRSLMKLRSVFAVALLVALQAHAEKLVSDGLAVIVNDALITYQDVALTIQDAVNILEAQYGRQPEIFDARLRELREQATQRSEEH